MLDTGILFHEAKLVKEEEESNTNTFNDVYPCSIQADIDIQSLQKVLKSNEQQRQNMLPILPWLTSK
jgi:hypothetical protein